MTSSQHDSMHLPPSSLRQGASAKALLLKADLSTILPTLQVAAGQAHPFEEYPDLPASVPSHERVNADWALAHLEALVVGRQFHRGSGDRHFKRIDSYPAFEGYSLEVWLSVGFILPIMCAVGISPGVICSVHLSLELHHIKLSDRHTAICKQLWLLNCNGPCLAGMCRLLMAPVRVS